MSVYTQWKEFYRQLRTRVDCMRSAFVRVSPRNDLSAFIIYTHYAPVLHLLCLDIYTHIFNTAFNNQRIMRWVRCAIRRTSAWQVRRSILFFGRRTFLQYVDIKAVRIHVQYNTKRNFKWHFFFFFLNRVSIALFLSPYVYMTTHNIVLHVRNIVENISSSQRHDFFIINGARVE